MTSKMVPEPESAAPVGANPACVARVFGELRFHTDGDILALAFSAADTLWTVEEPGLLRRWDALTGRRLGETFLSDVETLWQFGDGARLLASGSDELSLWDVNTGHLMLSRPQPSWVTAIGFAPQASWIATGHDDGKVRLWGLAEKESLRTFEGHRLAVSGVAFSPDGTRLACAGEDRTILIWDVATGARLCTLEGHTDRIHAIAWHPNGDALVSAGWDTTARVWDTRKCEPIILLNAHADQVVALAFSPDGETLASADSADAMFLWRPVAGKIVGAVKEHGDEIRCLAFTPDGRRLASGGADRKIHVHELSQIRPGTGVGSTAAANSGLSLSPDGTKLASACMGSGCQVWLTESGATALELEGAPTETYLASSSDGRWIAAGGSDSKIRLWDATTGRLQRTLEGQRGRVAGLSFASDSRTLASASDVDGMVWIWDITTGEPVLVIPIAGDNCMIEAIAYQPCGNLLAVGGIDWLATGGSGGAVCLWDIVERQQATTLDSGATVCLAFHPTGRSLAAGTFEGSITLWDVPTQQCTASLEGHDEIVTALAYSPDGRWLASGSNDRTIRLWDPATGTLRAAHRLDTQVKGLCFSPDSRFLYTGNGNTTSYQMELRQLLSEEG
jgi:WD40 repeat protein